MTFEAFLQTDIFNWLIMPLLIILSRVFDVTLGTIRVAFISKGHKNLAPIIGFFEVLIWIIVVRQIFKDVTNPLWFVAYAIGFGLGTYLGIIISEKLSVGKVLVRVITTKDTKQLIKELKESKFGFTVTNSEGKQSKGKIIFSVIYNKELTEFLKIINKNNPKAFFTVEDVRKVSSEEFEKRNKIFQAPMFINLVRPFRKSK